MFGLLLNIAVIILVVLVLVIIGYVFKWNNDNNQPSYWQSIKNNINEFRKVLKSKSIK